MFGDFEVWVFSIFFILGLLGKIEVIKIYNNLFIDGFNGVMFNLERVFFK